MLSPDIVSLKQFYASGLGAGVRGAVAGALCELWPDASGDVVLGMGYATPYLEPYLAQNTVLACMPPSQGGACWPADEPNHVFLSHDSELPLADNSVNRVLLVHAVEHSEQVRGLMHEIWRVLTPGGRVLAVTPNRLSLWARSSRSPFGEGRPYTMTQLRKLFAESRFTLTRSQTALYVPPTYVGYVWRACEWVERCGGWIWRPFGGVLLLEAQKQIYASLTTLAQRRRPYAVSVPSTRPAMPCYGATASSTTDCVSTCGSTMGEPSGG